MTQRQRRARERRITKQQREQRKENKENVRRVFRALDSGETVPLKGAAAIRTYFMQAFILRNP